MVLDGRTCRFLAATVLVAAGVTVAASPAAAAPNDLRLSRFAYFENDDEPGNCDGSPCGVARTNRKMFRRLVHDFSQVMASPLLSPAETLGQAGFAANAVPSVSFIPDEKKYWRRAVSKNRRDPPSSDKQVDQMEGGGPPSAMFSPRIIVRKGLPFSLEIAGSMSHIAGSDMFTVGTQFKWAVNEGMEKFPAIAIRGSVDTLVGARDLDMVTAGWDVSVSKAFPVGGVVSLTPYGGYQQLHAIGWSPLLNVRPQDPRPPQGNSYNPEFIFPPTHVAINRGFLGLRLHTWIFDITAEGIVGERVHRLSLGAGLDF